MKRSTRSEYNYCSLAPLEDLDDLDALLLLPLPHDLDPPCVLVDDLPDDAFRLVELPPLKLFINYLDHDALADG